MLKLLHVSPNSTKRLSISLVIALLLHGVLVLLGLWIYEQFRDKKLHKINAEHILILKRGSSLDKHANTRGAPPPSEESMASAPSTSTPLSPPSPIIPPTSQASIPPAHQASPTLPTYDAHDTHDMHKQDSKQAEALNYENLRPLSPTRYSKSDNTHINIDRETRREIDELYGEEWGDLGSAEKDFITSNLREIARITQGYLVFPNTAAYLRQSGENAIEFYLLPNGDIDGLKLLSSSGFVLLDKNSQKTIEIAYKDYPRPLVRTLIRFHISYILR